MVAIVPPSGNVPDLRDYIHRARSLLASLESLATTGLPIIDDRRADLPLLDAWQVAGRILPCLAGRFYGHPSVREGNRSMTSDLWVFAPHHGYARTFSREYRLGRQAGFEGGTQ